MLNLPEGKSNKSTTGVNSVKIGGEAEVSIRLKSTTSFKQTVPVTKGSDSTRVTVAWMFNMMMMRFSAKLEHVCWRFRFL